MFRRIRNMEEEKAERGCGDDLTVKLRKTLLEKGDFPDTFKCTGGTYCPWKRMVANHLGNAHLVELLLPVEKRGIGALDEIKGCHFAAYEEGADDVQALDNQLDPDIVRVDRIIFSHLSEVLLKVEVITSTNKAARVHSMLQRLELDPLKHKGSMVCDLFAYLDSQFLNLSSTRKAQEEEKWATYRHPAHEEPYATFTFFITQKALLRDLGSIKTEQDHLMALYNAFNTTKNSAIYGPVMEIWSNSPRNGDDSPDTFETYLISWWERPISGGAVIFAARSKRGNYGGSVNFAGSRGGRGDRGGRGGRGSGKSRGIHGNDHHLKDVEEGNFDNVCKRCGLGDHKVHLGECPYNEWRPRDQSFVDF